MVSYGVILLMRLLGWFLLLSGCLVAFAAVVLLGTRAWLPAFLIAGMGVEIAGLALVAGSFARAS